MAVAVIMPKQGQSVETCIISQWFKKKGDSVAPGDLLFSYETDKASFEEEAKSGGVLLEILFQEGDEVPVLSTVAFLGEPGEKLAVAESGAAEPGIAGPSAEKPASAGLSGEESKKGAEPKGVAAKAAGDAGEAVNEPEGLKVRVSPRARVMAAAKGVSLSGLQGTGPNGRIVVRDVEAFLAAGGAATTVATAAPVASAKPQAVSAEVGKKIAAVSDAEGEVTPLTNIRKVIAKAMHASLQNSAQLTHHMGADARRLLAFREEVKSRTKTDSSVPNITLNDMVCWCVIRALEKFPQVNSHFLGDSIKTFRKVHLGLAVDTPRGLMVPALRNAGDYSLKGLSSQLKALADDCRKGSVNPDLLSASAGTFTVSNLGGYGVEIFTPIINLPQVAILGVNTLVHRPADLGGGVFGFVPYIGLSLTYDHRAIDGGPATLFLAEIKKNIESFQATL